MKSLNIVALALLIVGGLNWLLVGLFRFDLVAAIFGGPDVLLSRLVYIIVGLAALWMATRLGGFVNGGAETGTHARPRM